jgi:predicted TIM-barrel fold metal-dependent hydrolase
VAYTGSESWTPADLAPRFVHVIELSLCHRIMRDSNWPVCVLVSTLPQWLNAAQAILNLTRATSYIMQHRASL